MAYRVSETLPTFIVKEHASFCPAVDAEKKGFYFYLQQVFSFKKKDSTYPFKQSLKQLVYRVWHMVSDFVLHLKREP